MNTHVMDVKDVKVQEVLVYLEGNAMEMQERIISLLSSRNLKRSESLILTIVQVVELYTSRNINAIKNLYILEILFIGQTIFILV